MLNEPGMGQIPSKTETWKLKETKCHEDEQRITQMRELRSTSYLNRSTGNRASRKENLNIPDFKYVEKILHKKE